ncbi:unnamed protein product [Protopolystoma xenopodis]|uniref:Uncharacterized protein n=1 Tax=Protopolystoma xenopodis TaxID=117903 RepID=A0A448XC77_9PLAT|nr:unnamed protein product [Protopolystoma xenopodis]
MQDLATIASAMRNGGQATEGGTTRRPWLRQAVWYWLVNPTPGCLARKHTSVGCVSTRKHTHSPAQTEAPTSTGRYDLGAGSEMSPIPHVVQEWTLRRSQTP